MAMKTKCKEAKRFMETMTQPKSETSAESLMETTTQKKHKKKNPKSLNPKLELEPDFWKMSIPIPILNLNLNWPKWV